MLEQRLQVKAMRHAYPNARILVEKSAGGSPLVEELTAEGVSNIELIPATTSKAARLDVVSPTIELGHVYLPLGMVDLGGFVEDLAGASRHDDDQDACSQAIAWLNVKGRPPAMPRGGVGGFLGAIGAAGSVSIDDLDAVHDVTDDWRLGIGR